MEDIKKFIKYFKPHKKLFVIDMVCAFVSGLISISFPILINYALNNYLPQKMYFKFFAIIIAIIISYIINGFLLYIIGYIGHMFGLNVESDMRQDLFDHIEGLSFKFFDFNQTGSIMSRVTTDLFEITEIAHHGPEDIMLFAIIFIGSSIAMFKLNWLYALMIVWLIPLAVIYVYSRRKQTMRCSKAMKVKLGDVNSSLEASISGIRVTQSFANEEYEIEKFRKNNYYFQEAKGEFYKEFAIFHTGIDIFKNMLKLCAVLCGGILLIFDKATLTQIITFNLFITMMMQPIQKLISFSEMFISGMAGFKRFNELMKIEPEIKDSVNARHVDALKGNIEIKNLFFEYEKELVLEDINLTIKKGQTLALVGPSGAGKSTLCQLIPRFYDITKGSIAIDGMDIRDIKLKDLRKNVGVVEQNVHVFSDTIAANILYGSHHKTMDDVIKAAKMAEIYEDIMKMENGFNTFVGEKGAKLSGGQKQRVSLARMFLKDPPIIIFDEATSALDTITELKIQNAIDNLSYGKTILVIAHRLSTIKNADNIAVIDKGKVIEYGNHEQLIKKDGEYNKMYYAQFHKE